MSDQPSPELLSALPETDEAAENPASTQAQETQTAETSRAPVTSFTLGGIRGSKLKDHPAPPELLSKLLDEWAGKLELTGSDAFKRRALEVMLKHKIEVRLKDPQQEALRRELQKAAADDATGEAATKASPIRPLAGKPSRVTSNQSTLGPSAASNSPGKHQTASETPPKPVPELHPIRALNWWLQQQALIQTHSKGGLYSKDGGERKVDLDKIGPQPAADQLFWFDAAGRRCDPPANPSAYLDQTKGASTVNPPEATQPPPVLFRGIQKVGDSFETTALLVKAKNQGQGEHLQGFIVVGGIKRHVIVHMTPRGPNAETGELRPNFLRVSELYGDPQNPRWREIGYELAGCHNGAHSSRLLQKHDHARRSLGVARRVPAQHAGRRRVFETDGH
jgi:hypothetical protein